MKNKTISFAIVLFLFCNPIAADTKDLIAGVAILPPHAEQTEDGRLKGGFIDIIKAIDKVYSEGNISIQLLPLSRSISYLVHGQTDFHIPLVRNPSSPTELLPYTYASEPLFDVSFVLYTHPDNPVPIFEKMGEYNIEVIRGTSSLFQFDVSETNSFRQGILKVLNKRTDGFLTEQDAADKFILKNNIKNIHRTHYATWQASILLRKGPEGQKIDHIISNALRQLKATGELKEIADTIHRPFLNWQPSEVH